MKVGFLINQLDNRGTGNAVFEYAYYNKEILDNESRIFTYQSGNHDIDATSKFSSTFSVIPIDVYTSAVNGVDVLYHIKSGTKDGLSFPVPYLVHAVFDVDPHGDRYATVSEWMSLAKNVPYVPHIIHLSNHEDDFREYLNIPSTAIVFGRHGGLDTFDISWAWEAINTNLKECDDTYYVFLNTEGPTTALVDPSRVFFLEATASAYQKRKFLNTCDAMLHARSRGETFGIACGEFSFLGKPVITYYDSYEKAHLNELTKGKGDLSADSYFYKNENDLAMILNTFTKGERFWAYQEFTPENVMKKFNEVFLK